MQKILLVGELNDIVRSLNDCLSKEYQVQLCPEQTKSVQAMIRIIHPDLVIICQIGVKEIDVAVFELLQDKYPNTPVLGIATSEGWKQCSSSISCLDQWKISSCWGNVDDFFLLKKIKKKWKRTKKIRIYGGESEYWWLTTVHYCCGA